MTQRAVLALVFVLVLGCRRDVASTVLAHAATVPPSATLAAEIRQFAHIGMGRSAVFNRLPGDGEVALILIAPSTDWAALSDAHAEAGAIRGNCYALPRRRSVVCDTAVFTARPQALLGERPTDAQRTAFARWVIGHELGHLATMTAGFGHAPGRTPSRDDLAQQRREYAADCWMVHTFARMRPREEQVAFETFAMDVINAHFRRTEPNRPAGVGFIFDYTSLDPYKFHAVGTHPDDILRSIRLLHIAAEHRNDVTLRQMMLPLVRKLKPDPLWTGRGPCGLS